MQGNPGSSAIALSLQERCSADHGLERIPAPDVIQPANEDREYVGDSDIRYKVIWTVAVNWREQRIKHRGSRT